MVGLVTISDSRKKVYSNLFCMNRDGNIGANYKNLLSQLDVGSSTHLSVAYQGNTLVALEIHDNGYCWNNERDNKRADIGTFL